MKTYAVFCSTCGMCRRHLDIVAAVTLSAGHSHLVTLVHDDDYDRLLAETLADAIEVLS